MKPAFMLGPVSMVVNSSGIWQFRRWGTGGMSTVSGELESAALVV
jgi:hypothetical protein